VGSVESSPGADSSVSGVPSRFGGPTPGVTLETWFLCPSCLRLLFFFLRFQFLLGPSLQPSGKNHKNLLRNFFILEILHMGFFLSIF
jgi:hypothetical protein